MRIAMPCGHGRRRNRWTRHKPNCETDFRSLRPGVPQAIHNCGRQSERRRATAPFVAIPTSLPVVRLIRVILVPLPAQGQIAVADVKARLTKSAPGQMMAEGLCPKKVSGTLCIVYAAGRTTIRTVPDTFFGQSLAEDQHSRWQHGREATDR